jgi:hypothetical protein
MDGSELGPLDVLPARVILNRIYVYHVSNMDSEQREKYDSDLYGWAETEADALAAVYEAAAMEAGE